MVNLTVPDNPTEILSVSAHEIYEAVIDAITRHQDAISFVSPTLPEFEVRLVARFAVENLRQHLRG